MICIEQQSYFATYSSYTYIELAMTSHVQQPNGSVHRKLGLLHLPHELLIDIFKAQTSFRGAYSTEPCSPTP